MQNGKIIANIVGYSLGFGFCMMVVVFSMHEAMSGYLMKSGREPLTFLSLFLIGLTGIFLSLRKKILGSVFLICSGLGINFYLMFINNFNDLRTAYFLSLPFLIAGILLLIGKEYKPQA